MIERKNIFLSQLCKRELVEASWEAYLRSNLKNTDHGMLAVMSGLVNKFDSLFGEAEDLAPQHAITEDEMKSVITDVFHMLLRQYMDEYRRFVNSPRWYLRFAKRVKIIMKNSLEIKYQY